MRHGQQFDCTTDLDDWHWLGYRHNDPQVSAGATTVWDSSPCNQSESRQLNPVVDLAVECLVQAGDAREMALQICAGGHVLRAIVTPATGQVALEDAGQAIGRWSVDPKQLVCVANWEFRILDRQVCFSIGETPVFEYDLPRSAPVEEAIDVPPLAVGVRGGTARVANLAVWRDVYYTLAANSGVENPAPSRYRLGPDEYFVLGDNSPHSQDSRLWKESGGVSRRMLVGRALGWNR